MVVACPARRGAAGRARPAGRVAESIIYRGAPVPDSPAHVQRDQPPGVPPLSLTGERTMPDVPAENYWFRRHLVVYEWIAARVGGQRVVDMACGEGYGVEVLARTAATVTGVDADAEAHAHAAARYGREGEGVRFVLGDITRHDEPCDAIVHLQTIEHVDDAEALLRRFAAMVGPGGAVYLSTPNVATLAGGAEHSGNPFHVTEYDAARFAALLDRCFGRVELRGLHHARALRAHQWAIEHAGWDRLHAALRITAPFYDRFVPAISTRDFALRAPGRAPIERALDFVAVCRP